MANGAVISLIFTCTNANDTGACKTVITCWTDVPASPPRLSPGACAHGSDAQVFPAGLRLEAICRSETGSCTALVTDRATPAGGHNGVQI